MTETLRDQEIDGGVHRMKQLRFGAVVALGAVLAANTGVNAQNDPAQLCVAVTGSTPVGGWTDQTLNDALLAGTADVTIVPSQRCVEQAPTPAPASDEPLPIEIVEQGLSAKKDDISYAAIITNPNASTWAAEFMAARVDVFDKNGDLITTEDEYITLLPGQTGVIYGNDYDARGADSIEVAIANSEDDWEEIDFVPGDLVFTKLNTKKGKYSSTTTGRVESLFQDQVENVSVTVVYRGKGGDILGAAATYVDFIPGGGTASFEVSVPDAISTNKIDSVEAYFEL